MSIKVVTCERGEVEVASVQVLITHNVLLVLRDFTVNVGGIWNGHIALVLLLLSKAIRLQYK